MPPFLVVKPYKAIIRDGISESEVSGTDTVKLIFDSDAASIVDSTKLRINNSDITIVEETED